MADYTLVPLETLLDPPASSDPAEIAAWMREVKLAVDELNSKIVFIAASAGITIPPSGG